MPPRDPRFLDATDAEILLDWWAHRFADNPKLRDEIVTDDFDREWEAFERASSTAKQGDWETVVDETFRG